MKTFHIFVALGVGLFALLALGLVVLMLLGKRSD
jgi:hypothetical protein